MILKIDRLRKRKNTITTDINNAGKKTSEELTFIDSEFIDNITSIDKTNGFLKLYKNNNRIEPAYEIQYETSVSEDGLKYQCLMDSNIDSIYIMNDKGQTIERIK